MALLEMDLNTLRTRANDLEAQRQQQSDVMKRLRILIMNLNESWKGEAQEAFIEKFTANQHLITEFSSTLEEYISMIRKAADETEQVDRELLAAVNRI